MSVPSESLEAAERDFPRLKQVAERREALALRLATAREALKVGEKRRREVAGRLSRSTATLDRLRGFTLAAAVAALRGTRAERLAAAAEESAEAVREHRAWTPEFIRLQTEVAQLETALAGLHHAKERYAAALDARERRLMAEGGELGERVRMLADELAAARAAAGEMEAAVELCRSLSYAVSSVERNLAEASRFHEWDRTGEPHEREMNRHLLSAQRDTQRAEASFRALRALGESSEVVRPFVRAMEGSVSAAWLAPPRPNLLAGKPTWATGVDSKLRGVAFEQGKLLSDEATRRREHATELERRRRVLLESASAEVTEGPELR